MVNKKKQLINIVSYLIFSLFTFSTVYGQETESAPNWKFHKGINPFNGIVKTSAYTESKKGFPDAHIFVGCEHRKDLSIDVGWPRDLGNNAILILTNHLADNQGLTFVSFENSYYKAKFILQEKYLHLESNGVINNKSTFFNILLSLIVESSVKFRTVDSQGNDITTAFDLNNAGEQIVKVLKECSDNKIAKLIADNYSSKGQSKDWQYKVMQEISGIK